MSEVAGWPKLKETKQISSHQIGRSGTGIKGVGAFCPALLREAQAPGLSERTPHRKSSRVRILDDTAVLSVGEVLYVMTSGPLIFQCMIHRVFLLACASLRRCLSGRSLLRQLRHSPSQLSPGTGPPGLPHKEGEGLYDSIHCGNTTRLLATTTSFSHFSNLIKLNYRVRVSRARMRCWYHWQG